jgi:hypothetical protein
MRKSNFSMLPSSLAEWGAIAAISVAIATVFAVVARSLSFRNVVVFWYLWSGLVVLLAFHLIRRGVLISRHLPEVVSVSDRIILACIQVLGVATFIALYLRR